MLEQFVDWLEKNNKINNIKKTLGARFRRYTLKTNPKIYRPSSTPFISGDTFRSESSFIFDETQTFNPSSVKNNDVVFKDNDYTQKNIRIQKSPIIKTNKHNDIEEIRINLGAMGTLDIDPKIMNSFYEAYTFFYKQLHSKKFQIDSKLKAGEILCFDNRRVLHGRKEFDPNSGNRHLQGYYIEREEIKSKLNYLNKVKF